MEVATSEEVAPPKRPSSFVARCMRLSTWDGIFAIQYTTLTGGAMLTAFLLTLGASELQIGLVAAFPLLFGMVQPLGAEIIRRNGGWRKPVCLGGVLVDDLIWIPVIIVTLLYSPPAAVALIVVLLGVGQLANSFVGVAWTSWISDLIPPRLRGRYFGTRNFICHSLGAGTAVIAGVFIERSEADPIHPFLVIIGLGVVFRLVSLAFLSRQPEPTPAKSADGGFMRQIAQPLSHHGFRRFILFGMIWGFAVHISAPFFTVFMMRSADVSVATVMAFASLGTIANLVGQKFWGPMCDRYGDRQMLLLAGIVITFQPFFWLFASDVGFGFYLMMILSMTGGFSWGGYLLAVNNLMMRLAPETGKTSYFAVQAALGGLFGAIGPFVGGLMADHLMFAGSFIPGWMFADLKTLFLFSFILRFSAWGVLLTVPDPVARPRLRAALLIRDAVQTFNPQQGFSPLLNVFSVVPRPGRSRKRRERSMGGDAD